MHPFSFGFAGWPFGPAASGVTPVSILGADCILWLRSDLGVTISTGVSLWEDQSDSGNDVSQGTASKQPALVAAQLGGHPAIDFTAASTHQLDRSVGYSGVASGDSPRVFVLGLMAAKSQALISTGNGFGNNNRGQSLFGADSGGSDVMLSRSRLLPSVIATAIEPSSSLGANHLYESLPTSAFETELRVDGSLVAVSSTAATGGLESAQSSLRIGGLQSGSHALQGQIYEVVIANPPPSASATAKLLSYFASRYPSLGL